MPIDVTCGKCGASMKAKDEAAGKTFPCPKCQESVLVRRRAIPWGTLCNVATMLAWGVCAAWAMFVGVMFTVLIGGAESAIQEAAAGAVAAAAVVIPYVICRATQALRDIIQGP